MIKFAGFWLFDSFSQISTSGNEELSIYILPNTLNYDNSRWAFIFTLFKDSIKFKIKQKTIISQYKWILFK